jgi:hypothetical protein
MNWQQSIQPFKHKTISIQALGISPCGWRKESHRVNERLPHYCAIALGFQLRRLHTVHLRRISHYCAIALGFQLRRLHTVHLRRISHYRAIALGLQLRRLHNVHLVRKPNITHHRFIGILIVL